jgi:hypothetical protein
MFSQLLAAAQGAITDAGFPRTFGPSLRAHVRRETRGQIASPSFDAAIASDGAAVSGSLFAAMASDGADVSALLVSALVVSAADSASISR